MTSNIPFRAEALWVACVFVAVCFINMIDLDDIMSSNAVSEVINGVQSLVKAEATKPSKMQWLTINDTSSGCVGSNCSGVDETITGTNEFTANRDYSNAAISYIGTTTITTAANVIINYGSGAVVTMASSSVTTFSGLGNILFGSGSTFTGTSATAIFTSAVSFTSSTCSFTGSSLSFSSLVSFLNTAISGNNNLFKLAGSGLSHTFESLTIANTQVFGIKGSLMMMKTVIASTTTSFWASEVDPTQPTSRTTTLPDATAYPGGTVALCGTSVGVTNIASTAALTVDGSCAVAAASQPTVDTTTTNTAAAVTSAQADMAAGSLLQFTSISSASNRWFAKAFTTFVPSTFEVATLATATGSFDRVVAVLQRSSTAQACPSKACTTTTCASGMTCSCTWSETTATNSYCIASFKQETSDDSNGSLWGLLALLLIPLLAIVGFCVWKSKQTQHEPEQVYEVVDTREVVPTYPTAEYPEEVAPVYPTASVEYPMDEFYAGQPVQLNVSPY